MTESDRLAERFEEQRTHLRAVAYRMLGSAPEADDAVQEAWVRLSRSDPATIENLGGWLTTVVSRVALDMLRSRVSRREDPAEAPTGDGRRAVAPGAGVDPEHEAVLADSVGAALLVVLDTLAPAERLAFVLHDLFAVPFEEIATILGRSPNAAKQLASRARHKVQGSTPPADAPDRQRAVVAAFLAASRQGRFDALVALLHPDVVLQADGAAVRMGSPAEVLGTDAIAATFSGRALAAQAAVIDGGVGLVWFVDDRPKVAWDFVVADGRIVHIDMLAAGDTLAALELAVLPSAGG
jgi:RNA polymerase sigma factor (sigma-70 family)